MKKLRRIHHSSDIHWVGNGFPVRSVFTYNDLGQELSPFLLLDYAAPYQFSPSHERRGVGAHPHKGFETVTITYQGELEHRDSSGGGGKIGPGDVQWMTAGRGIIHEEFHSPAFTESGGLFQVIQLWVNLRAKDKNTKPGYQTLLKDQIPTVSLPNQAGTVRIIAGEFSEKKGPAKTFSPINLWDIILRGDHSAEFPISNDHTTAFFVLNGQVEINNEKTIAQEGDLAIFESQGTGIFLKASANAHLLIMSGEPFHEPIVGHGPFVMNSRAEIQQAFEDFQFGRMGKMD
ncbi:MAG: pirin family protein [Verrucomicrobiae bacterium]|nr:pirin family protein [Verrucomicrobiae bacterium]